MNWKSQALQQSNQLLCVSDHGFPTTKVNVPARDVGVIGLYKYFFFLFFLRYCPRGSELLSHNCLPYSITIHINGCPYRHPNLLISDIVTLHCAFLTIPNVIENESVSRRATSNWLLPTSSVHRLRVSKIVGDRRQSHRSWFSDDFFKYNFQAQGKSHIKNVT